MISRLRLFAGALLALLPLSTAGAETYKIGSSLGLTGYASSYDRAWRDSLLIAAEALNAKGGINGRKVELLLEDNHSEPLDAVAGYSKMLSAGVDIFASGCLSAGNFAAAGRVVRAKVPMILCSILPPRPEEQKWAFGFLAPARFETETRFQYLRDRTQIRKIGILHDPSPYALLVRDIATKTAAQFGLEIVSTQSYRQDDADISVQIGNINAAGAGAIVKIGGGAATIVVAKNIVQLGLDKMLLLDGQNNVAVFRGAGPILGTRLIFVASPVQLVDADVGPETRKALDAFLPAWQAKHGDADAYHAARGWDAMMIIAQAVKAANSFDGSAVRDALDRMPVYYGAAAVYRFTPDQHAGVSENPFLVGTYRDGKLVVMK